MSLLPEITSLADLIERDIREREAAAARKGASPTPATPSTGNTSSDDAAGFDSALELVTLFMRKER